MPPYGVCRVLPSETHQDLSQLVCVCRMRRALGREQTWLSWPGEAGDALAALSWCVLPAPCRRRALRRQDWMSFLGVTPSNPNLRLWGGALGGPGGRPSV